MTTKDTATPWHVLITPEFEDEHGPYAAFAAWERWMKAQPVVCGDIDGSDLLDTIDDLLGMTGRIALCWIMSKACEP